MDHAARLDARDLLGEVAALVDGLPPKQRVALVMRKYQGLGYDEIAATLETSETAARTNVHEALRKLRERFDDRLFAAGNTGDDPQGTASGTGRDKRHDGMWPR